MAFILLEHEFRQGLLPFRRHWDSQRKVSWQGTNFLFGRKGREIWGIWGVGVKGRPSRDDGKWNEAATVGWPEKESSGEEDG